MKEYIDKLMTNIVTKIEGILSSQGLQVFVKTDYWIQHLKRKIVMKKRNDIIKWYLILKNKTSKLILIVVGYIYCLQILNLYPACHKLVCWKYLKIYTTISMMMQLLHYT